MMTLLIVFVDDLYCYYQNGINKPYWGHFKHKSPVITNPNSKWAEQNWFLCDFYLPYMQLAAGYIISADVIHKIAITSDHLQLYSSEDIYVSKCVAECLQD